MRKLLFTQLSWDDIASLVNLQLVPVVTAP